NNDQNVALSSATSGATIRYTFGANPIEPGSGSSAATSVTVGSSGTLKAKAWATNYAPSPVSRTSYTLVTATPTITPNGGGPFGTAQTVTLATTTTSASIYYTTDGSTPTPTSTLYTSPLMISTYTVLKTMASKSGYTDSGVASATFSF